MGGEKNKSKRKERTIKDWRSVVSFKYYGCKNVKKKKTHAQAAGREGEREVSHRRSFGKLALSLSICLS
jgi:hypothetical protein